MVEEADKTFHQSSGESMKKFLSSVLGYVVTHTILLLLVLSVLTENENFASIAISVNWVIIVLGWFITVAMVVLSFALVDESWRGDKENILKILIDLTKKKGIFSRFYGWLTFSVAICLMAYTGWVVSAVIYGITSFLFTLGASIARDKIEEYKPA
ncbi:hypothetical protein FNZ18_19760 [Salmonella enterica subsp. salamae]|nr:hypothetical protein [Salmonella enterica subsp. salamae]